MVIGGGNPGFFWSGSKDAIAEAVEAAAVNHDNRVLSRISLNSSA
jgi:hypothetical protein